MALTQKYGIKYPFTLDNDDELFVDTNNSYEERVKSRVLHVLFTPKGQRIRDPEFGTRLIKFLFEPSDDLTFETLKQELRQDINNYVPEAEFQNISINNDDKDDTSKIIIASYKIKNSNEITSVAVKI